MQCSGETRPATHHGVKNSACKNTPPLNRTTLKTSDKASVPAFLPRSGVSVTPPGASVIEHRPSADIQIAASADRLGHASAHSSRKGHEK